MTAPHTFSAGLDALVERHHREAYEALEDPGHRVLDAVGWISAHVAAADRVLYPAARPLLPDGGALLRAQRMTDRRLLAATWRLDRRLTGAVTHVRLPVDALTNEVERWLGRHLEGEQRLLDAVRELEQESRRRLVERLATATAHAPTRPHPLAPHARVLGVAAFRLDAAIDRIRDTLDTRHVPVPRPERAPVAPGRWGLYALGVVQREGPDAAPSRGGSDSRS